MSYEDPAQHKAWDKLTLGTHEFPGVARASGECMRALKLQKSNASDGAPIDDGGYKNMPIDITVKYLSADHKKMKTIVDAIHPRTQGKNRAPLAVKLEQINFLGVNQVYIKSIGMPQISKTGLSINFKCWEYTKDKPKPPPRPPVNTSSEFFSADPFDRFAPSGIDQLAAFDEEFPRTP